ncbi:uncharacterized protein LOC117121433 [Anneissia japonica]|uniref:uncharacterized protein LOC117121433 n=1 Tax=Anneissia japonica TaxID=1529436 RepID=UPI001425BB76|nr:uncharacterized protein LOC117121433 [Anneissia japonica]XP_033122531.1 uncharacterized protein LOC117121433 [Anneissia japonica]
MMNKNMEEDMLKCDSEEIFQELKSVVSEWYDSRGYIDNLKVLYRDLLSPAELHNASMTIELLNLLSDSDELSSKSLTLLYDTITISKQFALVKQFEEQLPLVPVPKNIRDNKISKFTPHRQRLMKLGKQLTNECVAKIDGLFNKPLKKYPDSWCLILDLENRGLICKGEMTTFRGKLEKLNLTADVCRLCKDDESQSPVFKKAKLVLPSNQVSDDESHLPALRRPSQDEIIRQYLHGQQQKVCRNANRFTPATWNTRYQVDVAHMFTDLDLLKQNKKKQDAKPTTLKEILEIFKCTPACRALIDGEGGIGKTTLLRYLAYNWATNTSDEIFKDKIVFPVGIRDMEAREDVLDVIVKQINFKHFNLKTNLLEDPKLIKRFILNHDDEVVFLLDGLDELRDGNECPSKLFKREELESSTVILTSRSENIDEFINESSVHVKVKGFNAGNIKIYINKYFDHFEEEGQSELGDTLIRELQVDAVCRSPGFKHRDVYSMCKNPMLLLSVCTIWEESQKLPADKSDLLKEFFRCILNQFIDKQKSKEGKISVLQNTPKKYVDAMLALGKCMYRGLKKNQLYINKKHLEGNEETVTLASKLGFVYEDASSFKAKFEHIFTAPHKLIVESLVGFYFYKLCHLTVLGNDCKGDRDMANVITRLDDNEWVAIRENKYLHMARVFAIGFLGANAGLFLSHWITKGFSTFPALMTYLNIVKDKHMSSVVDELSSSITRADIKLKSQIDKVCKSLRRFILNFNPSLNLSKDEPFIKLMRKMYNDFWGPCQLISKNELKKLKTITEAFCNKLS